VKLKCDKHGRRVLSVSNSPSFLHRTGDMSQCDSQRASLVDSVSKTTRSYVVMAFKHDPSLFSLHGIGINKEPNRYDIEDRIDLTRYTRPQE
jgi:hypothetical protein